MVEYENRHTNDRQKPIDHRKLEAESSVALNAIFSLCIERNQGAKKKR